MSYSFAARKRIRKSFGKITAVAEMPNLIDIQSKSYESFLQTNLSDAERGDSGLNGVLSSVFPINDSAGTATLEYIGYSFDNPKYDVEECRQRGINFSAPLKVKLRLIVWHVDEDTGSREIKGIKEQDVYMGDVPLMTKNGTFIVNGTERVIVSQMHRSPGVFFDHDKGKTHSSGKYLYSARIIPYRGSWLDFEFDPKNLVFFRIDRRRKLLIGSLLRALKMDEKEIFDTFYDVESCKKVKGGWTAKFDADAFKGIKLTENLVDAKGKVVAEAETKMTPRLIKKLISEGLESYTVSSEGLVGKILASEVVSPETGEVLASLGAELTQEIIDNFEAEGIKEIQVLVVDANSAPYIRNSLSLDKNASYEDAMMDIYRVMRPGEPATIEAAEELFQSLFFDGDRYDLSAVGRVKLNARLGLDTAEEVGVLTKEDILEIIKMFINIKDGKGETDDIDHLGNRRVRSVGELMENQFRIGLVRMERAIIERMAAVEIDTVMPHDLINSKLLGSVLREFFGSSQLSQFMDQTNPLAEVTHKRRLSALGPGGLTRERAGFEVRDVHTTHYGRMCPIETPEGPNIGLINSLATYANINKYGFIESPYRRVVNGVVTNDVDYLSAIEEGKYIIAQSNAEVDSKNKFVSELISCRKAGEFIMSNPTDIDYIDVSPMQVISVAASLIPFLENDDANRALMGSNMQRQAVPLLKSDAPLVGTGIESVVARDSGVAVVSDIDGVIDQVDANRIVVRASGDIQDNTTGVKIYNLLKYQRTNQDTCINQRPIVKKGDVVKKGDIIADGPSTDLGELALGRNVLVAFMPWNGYNYEDSILISERIVKDDVFTSVHIEQFEIVARDTRIGPEEITRDIPNVGEESLKNLDEVGIVHVGAEVAPGDIIVGKVTPKSESPVTPEEKLLRAIFGEKAADVRDSSLRVPPGVGGTIVEVRVFSRRGIEKDERALAIEQQEIERLAKDRDDELHIIETNIYSRLREMLKGKEATEGPDGFKGGKLDKATLEKFSNKQLWQLTLADEKLMDAVESLKSNLDNVTKLAQERFENRVEKLQSGDDLPQGALKIVKVFVAVKRKLQPGDKMAGRHGNKGVISRILPQEDMPYLEDGQPVDIVLNPLGVPSRMNVGQILETHLGWASAGLGKQISNVINDIKVGDADINILRSQIATVYKDEKAAAEVETMTDEEVLELANNLKKGLPFATPVFDGAKESDIIDTLERSGVSGSGQVTLTDGRTGEKFARDVTVGYIYMLKLHHLVDDKIHARSIGPYSLVTQQPLGGKSHFGGQRFGEMECWALQAYGASYTLQEMLTVKSDDVAGRIKMYESVVRGDNNFESGIPESFHVMIKELRSLCLNVGLEQSDDNDDSTTEQAA